MPDGQTFPIRNESIAQGVINDIEKKKNFYLGDNYLSPIAGMRVQKIGVDNDVNQSSRIDLESLEQTLQLPEGENSRGFWQEILRINFERRKDGKPWYSSNHVELAKTESGLSHPKDIVDFLDQESDNLPPLEPSLASSQRFTPTNPKGNFCGKCENGFIPGRSGWMYCSCNPPKNEDSPKQSKKGGFERTSQSYKD
jgi:hypothetical protein